MNKTIRLLTVSALVLSMSPANAWSNKSLMRELMSDLDNKTYPPAQIHNFAQGAQFMTCFVPDGPSCEKLLVDAINSTQKSLLIQAYSFTDAPIAKAILAASKRGVEVKVVVDKSQKTERYSIVNTLKNANIPVYVDEKPAIAHNKVMLFDTNMVFTGSFNFTTSAQNRNVENGLLIINEPEIFRQYANNWLVRYKQSIPQ